MNLLDWVLAFVVLTYAVSGYWQGFISGAFATSGLLAGILAGIWLVPRLLDDVEPSLWRSLGALFVVLLSASVGQGVLQLLGGRIRDKIPWQPVRALDALGGAALSVAAVLVVAWALGVAVSGSRLPWVGEAVRGSAVLERVDEVMPRRAVAALDSFNDVVAHSFFPRYLEPFAPERIVEVGPPPPAIARDPDVVQAGRSVVKIRGENACGQGMEGSGFVYGPDRIMTNAHVVAGMDRPGVLVGDRELTGRVVLFDADLDVAVVAVDGLGLPNLTFERDAEPRDPGAVLGYPQDGPYDVQAARIRAVQRLRSPDIHNEGRVVREVFSIRSNVRPGNSGGPMVDPDGEVLGVVFAASLSDDETGYVLTADQVAESAVLGLSSSAAVGTGGCA